MKRGFLKSSAPDQVTVENTSLLEIPTTVVQRPDEAPFMGKFPNMNFSFIVTKLPPPSPFRPGEPTTVTLLFPGAKEKIISLPDFPAPFSPVPSLLYRISSVPGAGLGMFATADIYPGELILRERPLLSIPVSLPLLPSQSLHPDQVVDMTLQRLSPSDREAFYQLHNCKGPDVEKLRGILDTNSLGAGALPGEYNGSYACICRDLSRVNHSCSPNAEHRWDLNSFTYELRALRPIKNEEQIFITYLDPLGPRAERRSELLSKYSFTCTCPSCGLSKNRSARSDLRRAILSRASETTHPTDEYELKAWLTDLSLPDDHIIKASTKVIELMEEEGVYPHELWPIHYQRLCKAYCAIKDVDLAREWATKSAIMSLAFTGKDGGWQKVAAKPESTNWWGLRVKPL